MGVTEQGMKLAQQVSGKKLVVRILAVQRPGPPVGHSFSTVPALPSQIRERPVTLSYTHNTHPFYLQAMLGGGDPKMPRRRCKTSTGAHPSAWVGGGPGMGTAS